MPIGDADLEYALKPCTINLRKRRCLELSSNPPAVISLRLKNCAGLSAFLEPLLAKARKAEPERIEGVVAARGMSDAAAILHKRFTLQATNVPYLGRGKQCAALAEL